MEKLAEASYSAYIMDSMALSFLSRALSDIFLPLSYRHAADITPPVSYERVFAELSRGLETDGSFSASIDPSSMVVSHNGTEYPRTPPLDAEALQE